MKVYISEPGSVYHEGGARQDVLKAPRWHNHNAYVVVFHKVYRTRIVFRLRIWFSFLINFYTNVAPAGAGNDAIIPFKAASVGAIIVREYSIVP